MTKQKPTSVEQLECALEAGIIDQGTFDTALAAMSAQVEVSGVIAQGQGATAVGPGGVALEGDNYGTINLGVLIQRGAEPGASKEQLTRAYLARLLIQANQLPLFAGDSANAQVRLSSVYTALLTQRSDAETGFEAASRNSKKIARGHRQKTLGT